MSTRQLVSTGRPNYCSYYSVHLPRSSCRRPPREARPPGPTSPPQPPRTRSPVHGCASLPAIVRHVHHGGRVLVSRQLPALAGRVHPAVRALVAALDEQRGCIFESSYEYPGRYARWTMGFVNPPLVLEGRGRAFKVQALNARGMVLLPAIFDALQRCDAVETLDTLPAISSSEKELSSGTPGSTALQSIQGSVKSLPAGARFPEEQRSRQPSIFSVVRAQHPFLGLSLQ